MAADSLRYSHPCLPSQLLLAGQKPETALSAALAATNFYLQQQQLLFEEREAQLSQKLEKMQAACRAKLKVQAPYTVHLMHRAAAKENLLPRHDPTSLGMHDHRSLWRAR